MFLLVPESQTPLKLPAQSIRSNNSFSLSFYKLCRALVLHGVSPIGSVNVEKGFPLKYKVVFDLAYASSYRPMDKSGSHYNNLKY